MTTYVLGAGASHHAGYPLAADLGTEMHTYFVQNMWEGDPRRSRLEELHRLYGGIKDLEGILTELDECPAGSVAATLDKTHLGNTRGAVRDSILMFFDSRRQKPALLYDRFAREQTRAGNVVITFNYDLSCERALRSRRLWEISNGYGFPFEIGTVGPSPVKILKLHGSTNWTEPLTGMPRPGEGLSQMSGNTLPERPVIRFQDLQYLGYSSDVRDPLDRELKGGQIAALLMGRKRHYVETSQGREREEFWSKLWAQAKLALGTSERTVIIGYSLPSTDSDAQGLLFEAIQKDSCLSLWCGRANVAVHEQFRSRGFTRVETCGTRRFEDFLDR